METAKAIVGLAGVETLKLSRGMTAKELIDDIIRDLQLQLEAWRRVASPVTDNPQEDSFYEKAEAE